MSSSASKSTRSRGSSIDSLFSESSHEIDDAYETIDDGILELNDSLREQSTLGSYVASRIAPPIPGLWVFPSLLPDDVCRDTINALGDADIFSGGTRDQVMLFEAPKHFSTGSSLPDYIHQLIDHIKDYLKPHIPKETAQLIFDQPLARQVILNLYPPGQGITPHVDLPNRYADGIIGCSLIGGCVMTLQKSTERHDVYMPPRTVYVLSGAARWDWSHGIEGREYDIVTRGDDGGEKTILRDLRVSVTFRWLKEGADLLC
ncbi:hypothetical protein IAT40_004745 [Kwoniella sp. CBS 6097]